MKVGSIKKQPSEVRTMSINYENALDVGDEINLITSCVVEPSGELTANAALVTTDRVRLWIGGGVDGKAYVVTVIVSTTGGEVHEDEVTISVKEVK